MGRRKVLLADQEVIFAEGVKMMLEPHFEIVGMVGDGRALIQATQSFRPDVIVADLTMPVLNGVEALRQMQRQSLHPKVIFLTMAADAASISEALNAGAAGYLLKTSTRSELEAALDRVLKGGTYITPRLSGRIDGDAFQFTRHRHPLITLTRRQREVLQLVAEGRTSKEIASILSISIKTVGFHRTNISNHLGLHSIAQLTRYAMEHGITG